MSTVSSLAVHSVGEIVAFNLEDDDARMLIAVTIVAVWDNILLCGVPHSVRLEKSFSLIFKLNEVTFLSIQQYHLKGKLGGYR